GGVVPLNGRPSLTAKMLAIAGLNVGALAVVGLVFAYVELGRDFESFLLSTARERILAEGRAFALDLNEAEPDGRDRIADRYARSLGMRVVLMANDGAQLTGANAPVPEAVRSTVVAPPRGPDGRGRGRGGMPPREDPLGLG